MFADQLELRKGEIGWVLFIGIQQIFLKEFCQDHEMFTVIEEVVHLDQASLIRVAVVFNIPQQLDLVKGLVDVVLVVEDHLQAVSLLLVRRSQIFDLNSF